MARSADEVSSTATTWVTPWVALKNGRPKAKIATNHQ